MNTNPLLKRGFSFLTSQPVRVLTVFLIPILTGLTFFYWREIHPFGDNSLLSIDLWGQYFPMYRQMAYTDSLSEMLYSWNGALGFNNVLQSAYYCHSLFLQIFRFIPIDLSIVFINTVCLLRLGFAAVTCLVFLEYKFRKPSPMLMAGAIAYGLCAYAIAFIMQFMWTDLVVLAPLILYGLERLLDGHSPLLYIVTLTLAIYTNFYVAFGLCLFILLYAAAELGRRAEITYTRPFLRNGKTLRRVGIRFVIGSAFAGAINAAMLLPMLQGISQSSAASEATPNFEQWYHTLADNVNALLPQTEVSLGYGTANIAMGLFLFLLIPLFFLNTRVRFRDKLLSGGLLIVLYIGLNYNPAEYLFNGFHFPNQLPGRWSFLFSLALVTVAMHGLSQSDGIRVRTVVGAYTVGVFFLLFPRYSELSDWKASRLGEWIGWISILALLLIGWIVLRRLHAHFTAEQDETHAQYVKRLGCRIGALVLTVAVSLTITLEVCNNAIAVATEVNGGVGTSSMKHYLNATHLFDRYGAMVDSGNDTFYRVENNQGWTVNDGQLGDYKSVSYYGSTMNGKTYELLRFLGNRVYALNISSLYNNSSPIQNSLFGIRYFIDKGRNLDGRLTCITKRAEYDDCILWENPTPLPLAFASSDEIITYRITDELRPLAAQNALVNALYGEGVNVFEEQSHITDGNSYRYTCTDNEPIFLEQGFRRGSLTVTVGDNVMTVDAGTEPFKYLGRFDAGTEITVTSEASDPYDQPTVLSFYRLNTQVWNEVYRSLMAGGMEVTSFDNTCVEGTVSLPESRLLFTTIPQDGGWEAYVDGKNVNTVLLADALLGLRVPAGEHTITFRYRVPGLLPGIVITCLSLIAFAVYLWFFDGRHPLPSFLHRKARSDA